MMQTVLGTGGQIAEELIRELHREHTTDLRLVSRNPQKIAGSDELYPADLTDAAATSRAVAGSEIAYLTVGLPMNSELWEQRFPLMVRNVIDACAEHGTRLAFFDNTYMYPQTPTPQTESTAFKPNGRKGRVRARLATMLQEAMDSGRVEAVICRAPEFYGPGKTQSLTNQLVFNRLKVGKRALIPLSATTRRSLIWTPDASRAMALLGTTPDAYGQTWHLPVDPDRRTYAELVEMAGGRGYVVLPQIVFSLGGRVVENLREVRELLPRYREDNFFDSSKFTERFPDFRITTYAEGVRQMMTA